jgi:hypothetical protein
VTDSANHDWTGYHTFTKKAARSVPSVTSRSNAGLDIKDSAILLENNYVALHDMRKVTDVASEPPASASWGGNFAAYLQHRAEGNCGMFGTLTGAIRAQLETTQQKNGAPINDACAAYFGIYNNGRDVGGFGLHVDAYHVGSEQTGHSTYGMSAECWKQQPTGRMAAYVARAQQGKLDYGLTILHSGGTFGRGIQFGNPPYHMGGVQGAPGQLTEFDVGIDLTWGKYRDAAIMLACDQSIVLSGVPQAQNAIGVDVCNLKFESMTGMFAVHNGESPRFDVNMSNGMIWQNGAPTWAAFTQDVPWAFSVGYGKTEAERPSATPVKFLRVRVEGEDLLLALYRE